jgi:NTE family protein
VPDVDLVLEGGGVKGLGTAGAVMALLEAGYAVQRVAGTSVGAVAACFVAAGADAGGFRRVLDRLDLRRIPDRGIPLPLVSESFSLLTHRGAYAGDWVHEWLTQELDQLGVTRSS